MLTYRRVGALQRRLASITRGEEGESLERILANHLERVVSLGLDVDELRTRAGVLEDETRRAVRRVGLVRFNPFEDTGSDQSFSLALLDEVGDGVIVTSLHTRGQTRIYAKAVIDGKAEALLSDEESAAVAAARDATLGRAGLRERTEAAERFRRSGRAVDYTAEPIEPASARPAPIPRSAPPAVSAPLPGRASVAPTERPAEDPPVVVRRDRPGAEGRTPSAATSAPSGDVPAPGVPRETPRPRTSSNPAAGPAGGLARGALERRPVPSLKAPVRSTVLPSSLANLPEGGAPVARTTRNRGAGESGEAASASTSGHPASSDPDTDASTDRTGS